MIATLALALSLAAAPAPQGVCMHPTPGVATICAYIARQAARPQVVLPALKPWPRVARVGRCGRVLISDGNGGLHPRLVCGLGALPAAVLGSDT